MKSLLDTHFLLWIIGRSKRLDAYPWIERYRPWGVSPVSFLEVTFLGEVGRLDVGAGFPDRVLSDPRFEVDDIALLPVVRHSLALDWTRDPFDRLLAAHSAARRAPLVSVDETIVEHHTFLPAEVKR